MSTRQLDGSALILGIVFISIAGWWFLNRSFDWHLPNAGWIVAGALIVLGTAGIARALRGNHDHEPPRGSTRP
jgi:hypothetical protein